MSKLFCFIFLISTSAAADRPIDVGNPHNVAVPTSSSSMGLKSLPAAPTPTPHQNPPLQWADQNPKVSNSPVSNFLTSINQISPNQAYVYQPTPYTFPSTQTQAAPVAFQFAWAQLKMTNQTKPVLIKKLAEFNLIQNRQAIVLGERIGSTEQDLVAESNSFESSDFQREFLSNDGLIKNESISRKDFRNIRNSIRLESKTDTNEGIDLRKLLNRIFVSIPLKATKESTECAYMSVALAIGADMATLQGRLESARQLLDAAAVTLDLALGFVPIAGSINDATQILTGLATGYDYTGQRMDAGDYALRGAGILLSVIPLNYLLRFGALKINRPMVSYFQKLRSISPEIIKSMLMHVGDTLRNTAGGIGHGIDRLIKCQRAFSNDHLKSIHMTNALDRFNEVWSRAGRELTKHPGAAGFEDMSALRKIYRSDKEVSLLAERTLFEILLLGKREVGFSDSLQKSVFDYRVQSGFGARFDIETGKMIGFLNPRWK